MKPVLFAIIFSMLLVSVDSAGQQSVILGFSSPSNLDSIKIENLNNKAVQVITGNSFEILVDFPDHVGSDMLPDEARYYPNPFSNKAFFELSTGMAAAINISVFDISGRLVASLNRKLEQGKNQFVFIPSRPGIYFLKASYDSTSQMAKILCLEAGAAKPSIQYNGNLGGYFPMHGGYKKSSKKDQGAFSAKIGDILRFTAYSDSKLDSEYDFLSKDKNYVFNFQGRYFEFNKYLFKANKPGYLNMVFSVSDTANEGIDYLTEDNFIVSEDNIAISPSSTFQNLRTNRDSRTLLKTTLLLDNSGQMAPFLDQLKESANKFAQSIAEYQSMAVYAYSDSAVLMKDFSNNKLILEYWIGKIKTGSDSSKLFNSIIKPLNNWEDTYNPLIASQGSLIVFSGGNDQEGENALAEVLLTIGEKRVYVISLDENSDSIDLRKIANTGKYFSIDNMNKLDAVFASIQADMIKFSNSIYSLSYMTSKTEGNHEVEVSIRENANTGTSAFLKGSFDASGFFPASPGVYLNPSDSSVYGLDTIRCFANRVNYVFTRDSLGKNPYALDSLILEPVTYGGPKTPSYTWEISNNNALKITSAYLREYVLVPTGMARDTVKITLSDAANGFSKDIVFIMDPPEFFENMGIVLGQIKDSRLTEISGIAASIKYPGHFWVHNDSGDDENIFLIDTLGNTIARVFVLNITSRDWEDIAVGPGPEEGESYIYIGDIGDNNKVHSFSYVYRLEEPNLDTSLFNQNISISRNQVSAFTYRYADGPRDAEILMIDPATKDLYIVTKRENNVQIYTMPYPQIDKDSLILTRSDVTLPFRMTNGGDISADGGEILIKNLTTVFYWKREPGESIIGALARKAMTLPYIEEPQGEAIAWLRDRSGYITVSEGRNENIYLYKRN